MTAVERFQPTTFDGLMQQAEMIARSNIVPKAFRGKAADVLVATLWGQEVGFGPMASLSYIDVIEGNPALNAEGKVAAVRMHGHSITGTVDDSKAVVTGKRLDNGDELTVEWTMKMATDAGLANKQNWKHHRQDMLWARGVSVLCRRLFADVTAGLSYVPEEVEAFARPEMNVVESRPVAAIAPPASVDPETGEVAPAIQAPRKRKPPTGIGGVGVAEGKPAFVPATPEQVADVTELIDALKFQGEEWVAAGRGAWHDAGIPSQGAAQLSTNDAAKAHIVLTKVLDEAVAVAAAPTLDGGES